MGSGQGIGKDGIGSPGLTHCLRHERAPGRLRPVSQRVRAPRRPPPIIGGGSGRLILFGMLAPQVACSRVEADELRLFGRGGSPLTGDTGSGVLRR